MTPAPLLRPRQLRPGDRVVVVSPAGPVAPQRLSRGMELLRSWGLDATAAPHAADTDRDVPYLAGRDEHRAADLADAWCDPAVRAVVAARGGYGAARLLPRLPWDGMAARDDPPWLVGSSDVTALHAAVARRLGVATLFAPMVAGEVLAGDDPDAASRDALREALLGDAATPVVLRPQTARHAEADTLRVGGRAAGVTVGGTVALVAGALGTPWSLPAAGGVAVLEDVGEPAYRLDRMLTQLLQAGWFDGVRGIALGSWEGCGEPTSTAADVLARALRPLGVPMVSGLPFGHGSPQRSVPLGVPATVDGDAGVLAVG